jgi:hypothetical protein
MVYRLTPHTLAMSLLGSTLILVVLWTSAPRTVLIAWYLLHHLVTLARCLLIRAYRRAKPAPTAARLWARRFIVGTSAAGLIWAGCGTVLFPGPGRSGAVLRRHVSGRCRRHRHVYPRCPFPLVPAAGRPDPWCRWACGCWLPASPACN